jgi:ubiquinone/menaquinone biosynthesis C-methylase UbiE
MKMGERRRRILTPELDFKLYLTYSLNSLKSILKKGSTSDFMNLGFIDSGIGDIDVLLNDWVGARGMEPQAYLYYLGLSKLNPNGIDRVLEVGSGLGGGTVLVDKMLNPKSIEGLDRSSMNVLNCRIKFGKLKNLKFIKGSYKDLSRLNSGYDLVVCVEASQHFEKLAQFIEGVSNLLNPDGNFVLTDLFMSVEVAEIEKMFAASGLRIVSKKTLNEGVLKSIALNPPLEERNYLFAKVVRRFLNLGGLEAHSGSKLYKMLETDELQFISYVLTKKQNGEVSNT